MDDFDELISARDAQTSASERESQERRELVLGLARGFAASATRDGIQSYSLRVVRPAAATHRRIGQRRKVSPKPESEVVGTITGWPVRTGSWAKHIDYGTHFVTTEGELFRGHSVSFGSDYDFFSVSVFSQEEIDADLLDTLRVGDSTDFLREYDPEAVRRQFADAYVLLRDSSKSPWL